MYSTNEADKPNDQQYQINQQLTRKITKVEVIGGREKTMK